jgi:ubiquinone/menaquinone biosynthesis C-methylase UbiE
MGGRFDGSYGRAYDALVSRPRVLRVAGTALGRATAIGDLPFLARAAYTESPEEPLLDVPCGAAGSLAHAWMVDREAPVIGLDLSEVMLERGRRRVATLQPSFDVQLVQGDALEMPFDDGEFGSALSLNGLHCIPDPSRFVQELARVVRPGGTLTMTTLVGSAGLAGRAFNGVLRRGGVLPQPPPSIEQVEALLAAAGWTAVTRIGGTALVALRCVRC